MTQVTRGSPVETCIYDKSAVVAAAVFYLDFPSEDGVTPSPSFRSGSQGLTAGQFPKLCSLLREGC